MAFDKIISTGYQDFEMLITQNYYYVDKTKFIEDFIKSKNKTTIITRPRTFGKSLNLSMLQNFMSYDYNNIDDPTKKARTLFKDLYISTQRDFCSKYMGQYPVIMLSFAGVDSNNFQETKNRLQASLMSITSDYYFLIESLQNYFKSLEDHSTQAKYSEEQIKKFQKFKKEDIEFLASFENPNHDKEINNSFLDRLINLLYNFFDKKVVLLIDEYDVPFHQARHHGYYDELLDFMDPIIGVVNSDKVFKSLFTGFVKQAHDSFYTTATHFKICDVGSIEYSKYFGFTKDETKELLQYYKLEQYYSQLINWYDGYVFGDTKVMCPWDVLCYCRDVIDGDTRFIKEYWLDTGSNLIIKNITNNLNPLNAEYLQQLMDDQSILVNINSQIQPHPIVYDNGSLDKIVDEGIAKSSNDDLFNILYHLGYLTLDPKLNQSSSSLDQVQNESLTNQRVKYLRIPNKQIYCEFKEQINERFSRRNPQYWEDTQNFFNLLIKKISHKSSSMLSNFLSFQLHHFISVKNGVDHSSPTNKKSYYYSFLNGFVSFYDDLLKLKLATLNFGNDHSNIAFMLHQSTSDLGVIIEINVAKVFNLLEQKSNEALNQIKEKEYVKDFLKELGYWRPNKIHIYGISFYKKDCYVKAGVINSKDYLID